MKNFLHTRSIGITIASALLATFAIGFYASFTTLYNQWIKLDETYGIGFLVLAISIGLVYQALPKLSSIHMRPCKLAPAITFSLSIIWFFAYSASITIVQQLVLPLLVLSTILAMLGPQASRIMLFPIGFLYFSIPIWDYLNDGLVNMTINIVTSLLSISNIPIFIEGSSIQIPYGWIRIADGCSGLRYLIVGCALSSLSAYMNFTRTQSRLLIICLGVLLSLAANWTRVYVLIMVGFYTQMQSPLMHEHDHFGWLVFFCVFSPVFLLSWIYSQPAANPSPAQTNKTSITFQPPVLLACLLALSTGPILAALSSSSSDSQFTLSLNPAPDWEKTEHIEHKWNPELPTPYQRIKHTYMHSDKPLQLNIYAYKKDNENKKLLPYIHSIHRKSNWHIVSSKISSTNSKGKSLHLNKTIYKRTRGTGHQAVWHWYVVGGINSARYSSAKFSQISANLLHKNYALVITINSECNANCAESNKLIEQFINEHSLSASDLISRAP